MKIMLQKYIILSCSVGTYNINKIFIYSVTDYKLKTIYPVNRSAKNQFLFANH